MGNRNIDIELVAGLNENYSEAEILKVIKILDKRLRANRDARIKLIPEIDETVINNTINKLQDILKVKELKIDTKDAVINIQKEASAMLEVANFANKASKEKLAFADANKKVADTAEHTTRAVREEYEAMQDLADIDIVLRNINNQAGQGASVFNQFGDTLRDAFSTYTVANLLEEAIYKVVDAGKEAVETVKQLDDINVDLQMATGEGKSYVKNLISDYNTLGQELGSLTSDVSKSADSFLRQGRTMEETNKLIGSSLILSKVAKMDAEESSKVLTATLNGFQLMAEESSRVNDILSSIDLESASDASEIGTALSKVAAVANNAGLSLEKTSAIIATISDITQDSAESIGTAVKTVLSRMGQLRAGRFVDEQTGESLNDVDKVLGKISVSLTDTNGMFKDAEVIIDEVGKKWHTLDRNTQNAVASAMAGTYQYNKLVSMFDNYNKVINLTETAMNSQGKALEKFEKSYLTSLEAKTNSLKSSLEELAYTTISDELYADVLDVTKAMVDMTTQTGILRGLLAGLGTSGLIYGFSQLATFLRSTAQEFSNLGEAINITQGGQVAESSMERLINLTGGLTQSQTSLLLSTKNLNDEQKIAVIMNQQVAQGLPPITEQQARQRLTTMGVASAQTTATGTTVSFSAALKGLWSTMLANPLILVTAGISAATMAWNSYKQKLEEVRQATKDSANIYKESTSSIDDYVARYEELNTALENARGNEEETKSVKEQLLSLQNELNSAYGSEVTALNLVGGAYEENLAILKEYNSEKAKAFLNENVEGIKDATKQMTKERHYNLSSLMYGGSEDAEALRDIAEKYSDKGIYVNEAMDGTFTVHIKADAQTAQDTIDSFMNDLRDKAKELGNEELFSETIAFSSKELNRAKEVVEEFGNTYRQALQAEIVSDTDKAKVYNEAIEAVEKYNEAVLNSEDPYNDEKVKSARSNIEELKNDIDNNASAWEKYSVVMDDVFSKMEKIENIESNIMPDISANNPEIISSLSISQTVDQLNTQLKPTIDSLAEAYQNIFTADGFTRDNIGLDMFSSVKEELDNLAESGMNIDFSAYENFVSVLNDTESTAIQIKDAFDKVALAVANVSVSGLEDFETLKSSLEQLGYVDAEMVAFESLVDNMDALKSAGLDLVNATPEIIAGFANQTVSAENASQAIAMLTYAKELQSIQTMDTSGEVANLKNLAENAGYTGEIIQWLTKLQEIYQKVSSGTLDPHMIQDYVFEAKELTAKIQEAAGKINLSPNENTIDWKPLQKSASRAGAKAGKTFKEQMKEELSNLDKVIDYVGDIINQQVDNLESAKDNVISAIEAERDAVIEGIEAQKQALEEEKKALEDSIKVKEKQIKAIEDARTQRKAELDLMKQQYETERLQQQRTRLIYKTGNDGVPGQMVYDIDTKGAFEQREKLDEAKENLQILAIEREIDVLQDGVNKIDESIESLDKQIDSVNKTYDKMIENTENFYQTMIDGLQNYADRWQEIKNIEKQAEIDVLFKNLGIETTDILNMSEDAFNQFKTQYLAILTEMYNGETDMVNAINNVAQGLDTTTLETGLIKTKENIDRLNNVDFASVKTGLDNVSTGMTSVGNSASTASEGTNAVSDDLQKMNQSTEGLDTKLSSISTALDAMPTRDKFDGLAEACTSLGEAIQSIANALGVSDGSVSGLVTALQEISTISLIGEDGEGGIISQFQSLKTAVDEVTSAINGGGAMNTEATAGTTASPEGEQGGGAGGLTGAIKEIGTTTDETMGAASSEGGEGSASSEGGECEGVLGKFSAFKDSVDAVTKAIGTGEEETGSEEGASTLIGALQLHYEKAEETLPQVKSRFEELLESISACVEKLSELAGAISSLGEISIGGGGGGGNSFSLFAKGTDPNTSFSGMVGKAFAKGTERFKGLSKDEPLAITSEYGQPETIIPPDGNAMITTSPTAMSLKKGTVILNEEQTRDMLDNEPKPVYRELGNKTFELGVDYDIVDGRPKFKTYLNPDDFANRTDYFDAMMSRFNFSNTFEASKEAFTKPLYSIEDKLEKMTEQISNVNNNYNNT